MTFDKFIEEEVIPGGLSGDMSIEDIAKEHDVDLEELKDEYEKGIKVEMEHTDDEEVAKEISRDHLFEDPKYYTKLAEIENESVVTESKDMTFTDYLEVLDVKFKDAMAAVKGENGSDAAIEPTRGDILQNFTLFRNYVSSLTKKYKGDKTKLRFLTERVDVYNGFINESVVTEAKNTIGLAFKDEDDYNGFVEFIDDEGGKIFKNIGWDNKTKSWEVIMDVKVLDSIYGEGTPANKESGWYGALPGDFESVIIESVVTEGKFDGIADLVKSLHFETDPKTAEEKKIELGRKQGEVSRKKQIESAEYSLRRFRKEIKYGDGKNVDVFLPGSYDASASELGNGPHTKAVKPVKWNQRKYDQWLEDMAANGGADNAFDMAQNAKNEPGLIYWVTKEFRGEDPMQRIQWDIEAFVESLVNEGKDNLYLQLHKKYAESIKGLKAGKIKKLTDLVSVQRWSMEDREDYFDMDSKKKKELSAEYNEERKLFKKYIAGDESVMLPKGTEELAESNKTTMKYVQLFEQFIK